MLLITKRSEDVQHPFAERCDATAKSRCDHRQCRRVAAFNSSLVGRTSGEAHDETSYRLSPDEWSDALTGVGIEGDETFACERTPDGCKCEEAED